MNFEDMRLAVAKQTSVGASVVALLQCLEHHFVNGGDALQSAHALDHKALCDAVMANTPAAIETATNALPQPVGMPTPVRAYPAAGPVEPINNTTVAQNSAGAQAPMNAQVGTEAETPAPPESPAHPANGERPAGAEPNVTE